MMREDDRDRRDRDRARTSRAVHRQRQIELLADLRRPGGDRDRERPAVRRGAGADRAISRNRCSSRPRPPTCSRSSAARRSICDRSSTRWSSSAARIVRAQMWRAVTSRRRRSALPRRGRTLTADMPISCDGHPGPDRQRLDDRPGDPYDRARSSMSPTSRDRDRHSQLTEIRRSHAASAPCWRAADARRRGDRRTRRSRRSEPCAVHRNADRTGADLRRPGGDRDRERPPVRRGAGARRATSRRRCTYQTGSGNILKVIASSPTDVGPVLDGDCRKCRANCAMPMMPRVLLKDGDDLRFSAHHAVGYRVGIEQDRRSTATGPPAAPFSTGSRCTSTTCLRPKMPNFRTAGNCRFGKGQRTILSVPLLRDEREHRRDRASPPARYIRSAKSRSSLLQTFADQAVIAIENVRLFDEVQAKTRDLTEALTYQTGSGNILRVIAVLADRRSAGARRHRRERLRTLRRPTMPGGLARRRRYRFHGGSTGRFPSPGSGCRSAAMRLPAGPSSIARRFM